MNTTGKSHPQTPEMPVEEFLYVNPWAPADVRRHLVRYLSAGELPTGSDPRYADYIRLIGDHLKKLDGDHPWTDSLARPFLDERR